MRKRISNIIIESNDLQQVFFDHLSEEVNSRILVSGPFGSGKSTFLRDFFAKYSHKYNTFNLYPVHYSVATNQDIFELIKFDIIAELLVNYKDDVETLKSQEFSLALRLQAFLLHNNSVNINSLLKPLIAAMSGIGKPVHEVLESVDKLGVEFKDYSDKVENVNEMTIKQYLKQFDKLKGSIREMDDVSIIISNCLADLRGKKEGSQNVLVIDDLDRLDPDHIFRLFNIFSAHFDSINEKNKFGFDKVVFVCDIDNVRKMYQHRYGKDVDYGGYMNKFYSVKPFVLDTKEVIKRKLNEFFNSKRWITDSSIKEHIGHSEFKRSLNFILSALIDKGLLTLRNLDHSPHFVFDQSRHISFAGDLSRTYPAFLFDFIILIEYLKTLFPDNQTLLMNLLMLSESYSADYNPEVNKHIYEKGAIDLYIASVCLTFLLSSNKLANNRDSSENSYYYPFTDKCYIYYRVEARSNYNKPIATKFGTRPGHGGPDVEFNIFHILYETLKKCMGDGMIV
ncbi:P-loop NTPase fold protein [Pedobacter africanus]|uniref:KAP family P-loop domain-containing protein n=1 Tax=Pedobacter africanus TaxID=151894 RepID=A0A1W1Z6I6_9SPHI|nr:P-loop NTPase fold protein [Pedobacter africanus]SMC44033.1 KAP family P-loop domain-containing protein [Pedobacter africanus]